MKRSLLRLAGVLLVLAVLSATSGVAGPGSPPATPDCTFPQTTPTPPPWWWEKIQLPYVGMNYAPEEDLCYLKFYLPQAWCGFPNDSIRFETMWWVTGPCFPQGEAYILFRKHHELQIEWDFWYADWRCWRYDDEGCISDIPGDQHGYMLTKCCDDWYREYDKMSYCVFCGERVHQYAAYVIFLIGFENGATVQYQYPYSFGCSMGYMTPVPGSPCCAACSDAGQYDCPSCF